MQAFNLSTQERRQKQEDIYEFEVSLVYNVKPSQKKKCYTGKITNVLYLKKKETSIII